MSESLLPHMTSYNDQQVVFEMEKQIRELQRLIDVNEEIDRLELESEINEIKKEHDVLVDIMAHDYVDQLTNPDNPSFGIVTTQDGGTYGFPPIGEFGIHISKHHGDEQEITQTCEDCGMVFSGDPFSVNEESMDHVVETGHTTFNVDKIGEKKYHESLELPLEPIGALLITKTREWWDVQNYDDKLTFLSQRFIKAGELAKARWIHLPSHVKDSILSWVDRNSITEKFKSRKQKQWYHATGQTFYDDEPHENRKVEGEASDDIDWTEDKPDETPFYCPLCAMVIEETATYDGVFDHNKQVHGMSDEDSETLAKGFTYSNSPPTSEESKADEKGVLGGDLFSHGVGGVWDNISSEGRHKLISMNIYEFLDPNDVKLTTQVLALEETGQNLKWDEIPSDVRRPLEKAIIAFAEKLWLTRE